MHEQRNPSDKVYLSKIDFFPILEFIQVCIHIYMYIVHTVHVHIPIIIMLLKGRNVYVKNSFFSQTRALLHTSHKTTQDITTVYPQNRIISSGRPGYNNNNTYF